MIRVLIVDDAHIIRSSLRKSVEELDESIVVAGEESNGSRALQWLENHYADLCITDVRMPVMDGLELIRNINKKYEWVKSMVISTYDDFHYAKESIELEAVDYILKPINKESLHKALDKCIQKITKGRQREALELYVRKAPHHRAELRSWREHIRAQRTETLPLLIVDTLELLEEWIEGRYYLMNDLAMIWLESVMEELDMGVTNISLYEGKDIGMGESTIPQTKLRSYFRLCTVHRLEEGSKRMLEVVDGVKDKKNLKLIDQILAYIEEHYAEKINLQDLADQVKISRSYLVSLFKQETGMTVWNYIVAERMKKARDLLLQSNMKSYEIGDKVGYDDPIYFSQLFKKHFGLSPMEYKKRMEK